MTFLDTAKTGTLKPIRPWWRGQNIFVTKKIEILRWTCKTRQLHTRRQTANNVVGENDELRFQRIFSKRQRLSPRFTERCSLSLFLFRNYLGFAFRPCSNVASGTFFPFTSSINNFTHQHRGKCENGAANWKIGQKFLAKRRERAQNGALDGDYLSKLSESTYRFVDCVLTSLNVPGN